ncbi:MAG: helix-turn-helix transcriptional regulator [Clostridia bacterium]
MMEIIYRRFGKRVHDQRTIKGISQEKLAEICDVSTSYVGLIERGERKPSLEILLAIANTLHIGTDALLIDSIEHIASTNREKITMMINDFDDIQINTTYEIVNQIHTYIKKNNTDLNIKEFDRMLND